MSNNAALAGYYRLHARVYDSTRWSFLFGREHLLQLAAKIHQPANILEIGCGTGRNLLSMCQLFPEAQLTGIDLSSAMLDKAWQKLSPYTGRVRLINEAYDQPIRAMDQGFDLIVCSYALSMFNPGWERAIECAAQDLNPGGLFALVDFHQTRVPAFRRWMQRNHVRMEAHMAPVLTRTFKPMVQRISPAYGGLWEYLTFIGEKQSQRMT